MLNDTQLAGVARNPAAPASVLLRILRSGRQEAYWIAQRGIVPDEVYDAIVTHPERRLRGWFADVWSAPAVQRARLATDPDPMVRAAVAGGPTPFRMKVEPLPAETYELLSRDEHALVRELVLEQWADPPAGILDRLLDDPEPKVRARAAALSWRRRPELVPEVVRAGDGGAVEQAPLDRALALEVRATGDIWTLGKLAANPHLPADLVDELARHGEPLVRLAVSMRPELTEEQRTRIDHEVLPQARIHPARWTYEATDEDTMRRAATSAHTGLRRGAACNPHLPPDLVRLLAADEDFAVRLLLCENHPDAPAELLWPVYQEAKVITRGALLQHPGFPLHRLASLADHENPEIRREALYDPGADPALVDRLSHDANHLVRAVAAAHPHLTPAHLPRLLADPFTESSAARNPRLPVAEMDRILRAAGVV
ncbi:hypothetical protein [Streptomyces sp. KL116D]|uniref:hypothetical protein n=1 Tax=Streptomyces sp. KL116D TaxID=3045152 RepID=UPI0035589EC0